MPLSRLQVEEKALNEMTAEQSNRLSQEIIGAAIEVHKQLGPGLLESVYQNCLFIELQDRNIQFRPQAIVPLSYKDVELQKDFILDFLVEDEIIVKLKSVETLLPIPEAQLVTYLKLAEKPLGLLINFNVSRLTDSIKRKVYGFPG